MSSETIFVKIVDGPSKIDLLLSLFGGKVVTFSFRKTVPGDHHKLVGKVFTLSGRIGSLGIQTDPNNHPEELERERWSVGFYSRQNGKMWSSSPDNGVYWTNHREGYMTLSFYPSRF